MIAATVVGLLCLAVVFLATDPRYRRDAHRWVRYLWRRYVPLAAQPRVRPYHCDCACLHPHRDREPMWHAEHHTQVCFPLREYITPDLTRRSDPDTP